MNYIRFKQDVKPDLVFSSVQKIIKIAREKGYSIWFISYLWKNKDDKIWFYGFAINSNGLIQTHYWPEQVVPGKQIIVDLSHGLDTVVFDNVLKVVANPQRLPFLDTKLVSITE